MERTPASWRTSQMCFEQKVLFSRSNSSALGSGSEYIPSASNPIFSSALDLHKAYALPYSYCATGMVIRQS